MHLKQLLLMGMVSAGLAGFGTAKAADDSADRAAATTQPSIFSGWTAPSKQTKRNVRMSTIDVVQKVLVKPGQHVEKDQLLIQLDDREETARLKIIKADADAAEVGIRSAKEDVEFKKIELQRIKDMGQAAQAAELRKAEQEVVQAKLMIEKAEKDYASKVAQVEYQQNVIEDKKVLAPFAGVIEEINLWEGAVPDQNNPLLIIDQNEPLWVQVSLPTSVSQPIRDRIKQNEQLKKEGKPELPVPGVRIKYADRDNWEPAKFIYFNPLAQAASSTQLVRLEIPNAERRDAGLVVQVAVDPMPPAGNDKGTNVAQKAD